MQEKKRERGEIKEEPKSFCTSVLLYLFASDVMSYKCKYRFGCFSLFFDTEIFTVKQVE